MAKEAKPKKQVKSKAEIELDKMLAEARAAEAELAKRIGNKPAEAQSQPETKQEQPKQLEEKSDILKWFFIGLIIVSLVGGYFIYSQMHQNTGIVPSEIGLAAYNPSDLVKDWTLISSGTNLAGIEPTLRAEMMSQGVVDAAVWEFSKDDDRLYFWTRVYADNEARKKYDNVFSNPLAWDSQEQAILSIGDGGKVGIYKVAGANDPLMAYVAKDKQVWYISYFNSANVNGSAYDKTNITADKAFLVAITKAFYESFNVSS